MTAYRNPIKLQIFLDTFHKAEGLLYIDDGLTLVKDKPCERELIHFTF
jgi:hypothetical protein